MKYDFKKIEKKWQEFWQKEGIYEPDLKTAKKPFYNLMMFPYPSAEGLHVGNMYAFTGSDIYGRFKRMQGYDVFEPIGLDGFGIHSENYALKIGVHPMEQSKISEERFYEQFQAIGNSFAWDEKVETYDPEYYKWTQWIFVQMFKHGLAYRKKAPVNWCSSCKTVLADEQVIAGKCERCSAIVEKKELEQWFFKITDYADRLLNNLDKIDWSEKVKIAQRNWISKSEGALIKFNLSGIAGQPDEKHFVEVFTTRPDTIFGVTFLAISPELAQKWLDVGWQVSSEVKKYIDKELKEKSREIKEKTGIFAGIKAINPANKEEIPVWIVNYVIGDVGTGAIMAVPAHDERDLEFAKKFRLSISDAPLINKEEAIKKVNGKKTVQYRLRDWLISRQRYWGPPIPMIYCEKCNWQPVSEKELPVKLPFVEDFRPRGKGESPLAGVESFYKAECPKCGGEARRETDVSDTFLDSAWYYLRYPNVKEKNEPWNRAITKKWLPVQMYIGGAEHSVLHLLYARFLAMVFKDWGLLDFEEPFSIFRAHGLLIKEGGKMSKSKGNIVNPDFYIKEFGADTLRMYLMFLAPFEQGGDFRDAGILGIERFLNSVWDYVIDWKKNYGKTIEESSVKDRLILKKTEKDLLNKLHWTIKKVTGDIENLKFNTAISAMMIFLNEIRREEQIDRGLSMIHGRYMGPNELKTFIKLLAPFAPHITEEIWRNILLHETSIHREKWPKPDEQYLREERIPLIIQVNGKHRATISAKAGITQEEAEDLALQNEQIKKFFGSQKPKKIIFVPDRLINFVQ